MSDKANEILRRMGVAPPATATSSAASSILAKHGVSAPQTQPTEPDYFDWGALRAGAKSAANVPLLGYYPELAAALKSALSDRTYQEQKKQEYENLRKDVQESPTASKIGTGVGIAGSMAIPGGLLMKAARAPWLRMLQGAGSLAGSAFAYNPGETESISAQIPERLEQVKETFKSPLSLGLGVALPGLLPAGKKALEKEAYTSAFRGLGPYKKQFKLTPEKTRLDIGKELLESGITKPWHTRGGILKKLEKSTEALGEGIGEATSQRTEAIIPLSSLKGEALRAASDEVVGIEGSTNVLKRLEKYLGGEALKDLPVTDRVVGSEKIIKKVQSKVLDQHGKPVETLVTKTVPITEKFVSPSTAHTIQKRLQDSINWESMEGSVQPLAYKAGRGAVSRRVMREVPELKDISKKYHLQQTAEDIVKNKVLQEQAKLPFGPMEMAGGMIGSMANANPNKKALYALLGGTVIKGARDYGMNTRAYLANKLAKVAGNNRTGLGVTGRNLADFVNSPGKAGINTAIWEQLLRGENQ